MPRDLSFLPSSPLCPQQKTLARAASCAGTGVHGGQLVALSIQPAPAGHGIIFERTDLSENNIIPALWQHVRVTPLCTKLVNAHGVEVHTIEHLMAALYARGVDNARITINGTEVPILDGGATAFLQLIDVAGVKSMTAPRRFIKITKTVEVRQGDAFARFTPSASPYFSLTVAYPQHQVPPQSFAFDFRSGDFAEDVASARTFGFQRDLDALREKGLTLGGNLDNALLIDGEGKPINAGGYRFVNELARHKLLDAVGDIALTGCVILGKFEGHLSGHALNNALLKALYADASAFYDHTDAVPAAQHAMA